jgi:hypothetical protein
MWLYREWLVRHEVPISLFWEEAGTRPPFLFYCLPISMHVDLLFPRWGDALMPVITLAIFGEPGRHYMNIVKNMCGRQE